MGSAAGSDGSSATGSARAASPAGLGADRLALSLPAPSESRSAEFAPLAWLRRALARLRETFEPDRSKPGLVDSVPVTALPGGFDKTLMLNSNHPEKLLGPGIAVSTLPWPGQAHLGQPFDGKFRIFAHHNNASGRPLHQAIALFNPGPEPVTVRLGPSASYTTREAPYRDHHDDAAPDPSGKLISGPGDAAAAAVLRGDRAVPSAEVVLPPGQVTVLHTKAVPAGNEVTSTFLLESTGRVHAAVVFEDAPPTVESVRSRLATGDRLPRNPQDKPPTPPGQPGQVIFGRVAGVQEGATWSAAITTDPAQTELAIGNAPVERGLLLVGKRSNTLGTGQDQAAPIAHRYADSAYAANGNYGVEYVIDLPVVNRSTKTRTLQLLFDTPTPAQGLSRAFRGTIAITSTSPGKNPQTRFVHVNQRPGDVGARPLAEVKIGPGEARSVQVRLVYPADATPPHILRIRA